MWRLWNEGPYQLAIPVSVYTGLVIAGSAGGFAMAGGATVATAGGAGTAPGCGASVVLGKGAGGRLTRAVRLLPHPLSSKGSRTIEHQQKFLGPDMRAVVIMPSPEVPAY